MLEATVAFTLFEKALAVLGLYRDGKKARSAKTDAALAALYGALNRTKPYLDARARGSERNRVEELEIAKAWQDASIPLREIDRVLAKRCFIKSSYWLEPEAWNDATIQAKGIAFAQVLNATEDLLVK